MASVLWMGDSHVTSERCGTGPSRLCDFLRDCREYILEEWERLVRLEPDAQPLSSPALRDHFPDLLDSISEVVRSVHEEVPGRPSLDSLPELHALDRLNAGFDLRTVVKELALLRDTVFRLFMERAEGRDGRQVLEEIHRFEQALGAVTEKSVAAYAKARERTLVALDRISAAALGTSDLDSFLPRLLQVLLETTEAADFAAILLRDGDRLVQKACAGVDARESGIRALYAVPLEHDGKVIGVAQMGSRTAYDFSADDKQLFHLMAQRATSLIVQAQLVERLEQSELRFQRLAESGILGIVEWRADGSLTAANDTFLRMVGYDREDLTRGLLNFRALTPPEHQAATEEAVRQLKARGVIPAFEKQYLHKDGSRIDIFIGSATLDERRERGIAFVLDVTGRKRAEAEAESERQKLREVFQQAPMPICIVEGSRYTFTFANPSYLKLIGKRDILGKPLAEVLPGLIEQGYDKLLDQVLASGSPYIGKEVPVKLPHHAADEVEYMNFVYQPMRDVSGHVRGVIGCAFDVTDQVLARQASERMTREAQVRADFEQKLIGIVSHDLKNPISVVLLASARLLRMEDLPEPVFRGVSRINASGERASRLIRDLLDFTQARLGGGLPIDRRRMDLHPLVREVVDEVQAAFPSRTVELEQSGSGEAECDPDRVAQILTNLLTNAFKYGDPHQPASVSVSSDEGTVRLVVHNEGSPIPAELLPNLFEPLQRGTRSADASGSRSVGLGLYIVREAVRAHGGRVEAASSAEAGTTFTVVLPRWAPEPPRA